jgi:dephospho-CoA kinase
MPLDEKRRLADEVIDCSRSIEETRRQVKAVIGKLKEFAAAGRNKS